jgi:hypothetical protein
MTVRHRIRLALAALPLALATAFSAGAHAADVKERNIKFE